MRMTRGKKIAFVGILCCSLLLGGTGFAATTNTNSNAKPTVTATQTGGLTTSEFFSLMAQRIAAYLHNVAAAIRKTPGLTDQQKETLVQALSGNISYVQRQALLINNTRQNEDLQKRISELRDYWIKQSNSVRYAVAHIQAGRINDALDDLTQLDTKMTAAILRLKAENISTTDVEQIQQEFQKELAAGKASYTQAVAEFQKLKSSDADAAAYSSGKKLLNDAHKHLQKAHALFLKELQNIKGRITQDIITNNNTNGVD